MTRTSASAPAILLLVLACCLTLVAPASGQGAPPAAKAQLLEFSRPGCPICAQMEKILREVASRYPDRLEFRLLHIDREEHLFRRHRVALVPTLIVLDPAGQEVFRRETPITRADLLKKLAALGLIPPPGKP